MRQDFLRTTVERANRRRLQVFLGTFVVALVVSLGFTWLRPAEYRASARLEITPTSASVPSGSAPGNAPESARPFLTEVQVMTSRPLLERVATRLERSGQSLSEFGTDPIAVMQSRLQVTPVPSTNVVELVATGTASRAAGAAPQHRYRRIPGPPRRGVPQLRPANRWRRPMKK